MKTAKIAPQVIDLRGFVCYLPICQCWQSYCFLLECGLLP
jgi:hypothetical protein